VGGPVPLGYLSVDKKLVIVPEEAETVRTIFKQYLEVGSIRALMEELDRRGILTKRQAGASGKTRGGIKFGVGSVAHLLRNRFYIGEVAYAGKIYDGEQDPIVDRDLFEAVQAKLTSTAADRKLRLKGFIFDPDRPNLRRSRQSHDSHPRQQERRAVQVLRFALPAAKERRRSRQRATGAVT
jgi:hypothetical protein